MSKPTILVTGPYLNPEAAHFLHQKGYALQCIPPYVDEDDLNRFVAAVNPVGIISRMGYLGADTISKAHYLQVIAKHGVGTDNIDVNAATAHGIPVIVAYGANALSVAEHTIALLMAVAKRLLPLDHGLRRGKWEKSEFHGKEIAGNCLALVGFGATARETARIAHALGLKVQAFDPYTETSWFESYNVRRISSLTKCLHGADFVSLHCPLTKRTKHIINVQTLSQMKQGACLINTARGGLIDESSLVAALHKGQLGGAGLDTFEIEPPDSNHPFFKEKNIILSPHVAGVTIEASARVAMSAARSLVAVLENKPVPANKIINQSDLLKNGRKLKIS